MRFTLRTWAISRRPATERHPAFAVVVLHGMHNSGFKRNFKRETYQVPLDSDPSKNENKSLVKQAIKLSPNTWSIPWGMNFK
jgi:hypothetical protein